jgi:hypothetical protein
MLHSTVVSTMIIVLTHEYFHRLHGTVIVLKSSIQLLFVQRLAFWRMNLLTDHMTLELCLNGASDCCLYKDYRFDAWIFSQITWHWNCVWMVHPTVVCTKIIVLTNECFHGSHHSGIVFKWCIQLLFVQRLSFWRMNIFTDHMTLELCLNGGSNCCLYKDYRFDARICS